MDVRRRLSRHLTLASVVLLGTTSHAAAQEFLFPSGLTIDPTGNGRVWIIDRETGRIRTLAGG